jgi:isopenicillin N synthase-like dioxygenase
MQVLTVDYRDPNASEILAQSLTNTGFAVLSNHPIHFDNVYRAYQEWADFFASDAKHSYLFDPKKQDGFFPTTISETAKGNDIKDLKEYYHLYPWGRYPTSIGPLTHQLFTDLSTLAGTLLGWIEEHTPAKIRTKFSMPLSSMVQDSPQTLLRVLHYPPLTGNEQPNAIRAAAHEDINVLTLLPAASAPGLQVKDLQGKWHDVPCDPATIVVNVGDTLQLCSQGYYRSTSHRVINPTGEEAKKGRLSMPLFLHAKPDVRLSETHTQHSFLQERLRELGVL